MGRIHQIAKRIISAPDVERARLLATDDKTLADIWRAIFPSEAVAPLDIEIGDDPKIGADTWIVGQEMTRSAMVDRIVASAGYYDEAKPPFGQPFGA